MKTIIASVFIVGILITIAAGWVYQSSPVVINQPELKIPSNIDYFLAGVKYKSMNDLGLVNFEMQTPYLEHLIDSDISLIKKPIMQIYRTDNNWRIESFTGQLFHQQNNFQLTQNVVMQRQGNNPMLIQSEEIFFQPEQSLVSIEKQMSMKSNNALIHGSEAILNLKNQVYSIKNIKATYYNENS